MDEYESGMDPEVKKYFKKIINSFFVGIFWMIAVATAGLFFNLAPIYNGIKWYNILFYAVAFISLLALIWYFYKVWHKETGPYEL